MKKFLFVIFVCLIFISPINAKKVSKQVIDVIIWCSDSKIPNTQATATIHLRAHPEGSFANCSVSFKGSLYHCQDYMGRSIGEGDDYGGSSFLDALFQDAGGSTANISDYTSKVSYLYQALNNETYKIPYTVNMNSSDLRINGDQYTYDGKCKIANVSTSTVEVEDPNIIPGEENDKYSNIEKCTDVDVNHIKACGCIPAEVADITSKVYFILRLIGPIILLIIGGFEMAKAVASQDESSIEKAKKKLVNKFIAAAAIFLVLTIIKLGVSLVADNTTELFKCIDILLDGYVI